MIEKFDSISHIYAFGDSYSDGGRAFEISTQAVNAGVTGSYIVPANPPSSAGYDDQGKFTNEGLTSVEVLSQNLQVGLTNYATGGAKSGNGNIVSWLDNFKNTGVFGQVEDFTKKISGKTVDSDALYFIFVSANDFFGPIYVNRTGQVTELATQAVENIGQNLSNLAKLGAKQFLVVNAPNFSVVPIVVNSSQAIPVDLAISFTNLVNDLLPKKLETLEQQLDVEITLYDYAAISNKIRSNPKKYDLSNIDHACQPWLGPPSPVQPACSEPNEHYFWDNFHPTAHVHEIIGEDIAESIITDDDEDGIPTQTEASGGDRNQDGTPDSQQANVATFAKFKGFFRNTDELLTLVAPVGTTLNDVTITDIPDADQPNAPATNGIQLPLGFLKFQLRDLEVGASTVVSIILPEDQNYNTYWKYDENQGWFEFTYDGETGAQFLDTNNNGIADRLLLHLTDGKRGDTDGIANGIIVDPGAPGISNTSITLNTTSKGVFEIQGQAGVTNLQFTRQSSSSTTQVNEVGVFLVDAQNKVNGIAPGEAGFVQAALSNSQVIFSSLSDRSRTLIDKFSFDRQLQFGAGDRLVFYFIENGTTDAVSQGSNANVFFSLDSANPNGLNHVNISQTNGIFTFAWEETPSGNNTSFDDLIFTVEQVNKPLSLQQIIATRQGDSERELIDLTQFPGQSIQVQMTVESEADFKNTAGFYRIENELGTVRDPLTGELVNPSDQGYVQAAIRLSQETGQGVSFDRNAERVTTTFEGGSLFAPFVIANGAVDAVLDSNTTNDPMVYFAYMAANPDRIDHVRLFGDNTFGFEDKLNGGDFDYNDILIHADFTIV